MTSIFATYEDISDCWPLFKQNIEEFFPLMNICKPKLLGETENSTLIRNIPKVSVKFIPLKADLLASKTSSNRNERPYMHIFIGYCEDINAYRQQFRPKMKAWLESVSIEIFQQYLVILIENQIPLMNDLSKTSKTFLLDKIKFDFNDKVALKLVSLKLLPGETLNSIPECIDLISDCIYLSATMNIKQIDEEIRQIAEKRYASSDLFFKYIQLKDIKAFTLADLGLFSEALVSYEELKAIYFESCTTDSELSHIYYSDLSKEFSSTDINSSNWINLRESIAHGSISKYELETYIFSRKIHILRELGREHQILDNFKDYICNNIFGSSADQSMKGNWTVRTILYGLNFVTLNDSIENYSEDLKPSLLQILSISYPLNNDLKLSASEHAESSLEKLLNMINFSSPIAEDIPIRFKIVSLNFCIQIIESSPKSMLNQKIAISIELSEFYLKFEMLNEALNVLKGILDQVPVRWSQIRRKILDNLCECYWGMDIYDDYLIALLESLELNSFRIKNDSSLQIKIERAINGLKRKIEIPFESYFEFENGYLEYKHGGKLSLRLKLFSKMNTLIKLSDACLTLRGSQKDAKFNASSFNSVSNIIEIEFLTTDDISYGNHKISSIDLMSGNLHFLSDKGANVWKPDISFPANNNVSYEICIPQIYDFSDPHVILKVRNDDESVISKYRLESCSKYFEISKINDTNRPENSNSNIVDGIASINDFYPNTSVEFFCRLSGVYSDNSIIKLTQYLSKTSTSETKSIINLNINFPEPWHAEIIEMNRQQKLMYFTFQPSWSIGGYSPSIQFQNIHGGFNRINSIEIESESPFCYVSLAENTQEPLNLCFKPDKKPSQSVIINCQDKSRKVDKFYKIIPQKDASLFRIGNIISFKVEFESLEDYFEGSYRLIFDPDVWLLSGDLAGTIKKTWMFQMVPIVPGNLEIPHFETSCSSNSHCLTAGSRIFVSI